MRYILYLLEFDDPNSIWPTQEVRGAIYMVKKIIRFGVCGEKEWIKSVGLIYIFFLRFLMIIFLL